jgi:hypothetical protein
MFDFSKYHTFSTVEYVLLGVGGVLSVILGSMYLLYLQKKKKKEKKAKKE